MATVVKKCGCKSTPPALSEWQDKTYGQDMRLMNLDMKKTAATCTICGKEQKV